MAHIFKNDTVIVIAGKHKGKTGRVLRVISEKDRVLVQGVGLVKKHVKPNPQRNIKGGIAEQESPVHISNVALVDGNGKATRVGIRITEGKRERFAKSTGETLAAPKRKKGSFYVVSDPSSATHNGQRNTWNGRRHHRSTSRNGIRTASKVHSENRERKKNKRGTVAREVQHGVEGGGPEGAWHQEHDGRSPDRENRHQHGPR